MSDTTLALTPPRVHLSLYRLRAMWIDLAEQIDPEAEGADEADEERLAQLDELAAEILAAPVEAAEDWAALVDLADRAGRDGRIGDHLAHVAARILDQTRRQDRLEEARTVALLGGGVERLRDEFGAVRCRVVIEAETAAEVSTVVAALMASRNA